jgi:hypothetical protein
MSEPTYTVRWQGGFWLVVDVVTYGQVGPPFSDERHAKDFAEVMNSARAIRIARGEW